LLKKISDLYSSNQTSLVMTEKTEDRSTWAIGGGVLAGVGVGFFFLPGSPLAFVGSIILGLGVGLIITSLLSHFRA
jgi:F0F1-type ATP synthase assembly protein I